MGHASLQDQCPVALRLTISVADGETRWLSVERVATFSQDGTFRSSMELGGCRNRSNDNWKDSQRTEIEAAQLAPNHDEESALVETLPPGAYTAVVRGTGRTTGVGLVEVYNIP